MGATLGQRNVADNAVDYATARKSERFKIFARKAWLVDYWKVRAWADLCHPTTGDDFECK
jgi:hypothetical protein